MKIKVLLSSSYYKRIFSVFIAAVFILSSTTPVLAQVQDSKNMSDAQRSIYLKNITNFDLNACSADDDSTNEKADQDNYGDNLGEAIKKLAEENGGNTAISVRLQTGEPANINGDNMMTTRSSFKIYIAAGVLSEIGLGKLNWDTRISASGPSEDGVPSRGTVEEYFNLMIKESKNSPAKALRDKVGVSKINNYLHNDLGMSNKTKILSNPNGANQHTSTANDFTKILTQIEKKSLKNVKDADNNKLLSAMKQQKYRDGIPAGIPGVEIANKPGWAGGFNGASDASTDAFANNDVGIVYGKNNKTYSLAIMSENHGENGDKYENNDWSKIAKIAKVINRIVTTDTTSSSGSSTDSTSAPAGDISYKAKGNIPLEGKKYTASVYGTSGSKDSDGKYVENLAGMEGGPNDEKGRPLKGRAVVAEMSGNTALGSLDYGEKIEITYQGKSVIAEVSDNGPGAGDHSDVDLWRQVADLLKFPYGKEKVTIKGVDNKTPTTPVDGTASTASESDQSESGCQCSAGASEFSGSISGRVGYGLTAKGKKSLQEAIVAAGGKHNVNPNFIASFYYAENSRTGDSTNNADSASGTPATGDGKWREPPTPYGSGEAWPSINAYTAYGPFQFITSTWQSYKPEGTNDDSDRNDLKHAASAAGKYLAALKGTADADEAALRTAAFGYNHSQIYVQSVINTFKYLEGAGSSDVSGGGNCTNTEDSAGNMQPVYGTKAELVQRILSSSKLKLGNSGSAATQKTDIEKELSDQTLTILTAMLVQSGVTIPINSLKSDHGAGGAHGSGRAIDIGYYGNGDSNHVPDGDKLYKFLYKNHKALKIDQMIWKSPPKGYKCIFGGKPADCLASYGSGTMSEHYHHIHVGTKL